MWSKPQGAGRAEAPGRPPGQANNSADELEISAASWGTEFRSEGSGSLGHLWSALIRGEVIGSVCRKTL